MRLIDSDALKEEISSLRMVITGLRYGKGVLSEYAREYLKSILRIIDESPTIDAEPVRHGRWEDAGLGFMMLYACTNCGKQALFQNRPYPYCPNCGAKMDAKEEEP